MVDLFPHARAGEPAPAWLVDWQGDGILARIDNRRIAQRMLATGLPAVDLRGALSDVGLPVLGVDNREVARLAFEHLRDRGLRNFAFCGARPGHTRRDNDAASQSRKSKVAQSLRDWSLRVTE